MDEQASPPFLRDLSRLESFDEEQTLQVVIETPRGSRNKYTFDEHRRCFHLKKVLPAGMVFPYDFGFVPSTRAGDGDALDALVLMDEPAFPGCVVSVRLIGALLGENTRHDGTTYRNDRLLAVECHSEVYAHIKQAHDLPQPLLRHIEQFFETYPRLLQDKSYRVLGSKGPQEANALLEKATKADLLQT